MGKFSDNKYKTDKNKPLADLLVAITELEASSLPNATILNEGPSSGWDPLVLNVVTLSEDALISNDGLIDLYAIYVYALIVNPVTYSRIGWVDAKITTAKGDILFGHDWT